MVSSCLVRRAEDQPHQLGYVPPHPSLVWSLPAGAVRSVQLGASRGVHWVAWCGTARVQSTHLERSTTHPSSLIAPCIAPLRDRLRFLGEGYRLGAIASRRQGRDLLSEGGPIHSPAIGFRAARDLSVRSGEGIVPRPPCATDDHAASARALPRLGPDSSPGADAAL